MPDPEYLTSVSEHSMRLFELTARVLAGLTRPGARECLASPSARAEIVMQSALRTPPEVSVVIPTFERPDLLLAAAESVCQQRSVNLEIVIVNDSQQHLPAAVLDALTLQPYKISVVQHRRNLGLGAARNTGASVASGQWLLMLDDDDTLVEGSLRPLCDAAREGASRFVFGDHLRQRYAGGERTSVEHRHVGLEALQQLEIENPIMCGSFLIDRAVFGELGGYREDLPVHEDYNLHLRVLSVVSPKYLSGPVCVYHCRENLPRLNHRRLYWFATCAFNHAAFRALFHRTHEAALDIVQREYQYAHLMRAVSEGCPTEVATQLAGEWRQTLARYGLTQELAVDEDVVSRLCPSLEPRR